MRRDGKTVPAGFVPPDASADTSDAMLARRKSCARRSRTLDEDLKGAPAERDRQPAFSRTIALSDNRLGPRPNSDISQPRVVRGVPEGDPGGSARLARQARSAPGPLPRARARGAAGLGSVGDRGLRGSGRGRSGAPPERHRRDQHGPAVPGIQQGRRDTRDRPRLQLQPECRALRRRPIRRASRPGPNPIPERRPRRGVRRRHEGGDAEHQAGHDRARNQPDGADPARRASRCGPGSEGRGRARRRRARAGHAADPST